MKTNGSSSGSPILVTKIVQIIEGEGKLALSTMKRIFS